MTKKKKKEARVKTPIGRLSFPYLVTPNTEGEYADDNYKTDLWVSKADYAAEGEALAKAVVACAEEGTGKKGLSLKDFPNPITDVSAMNENTRNAMPEDMRKDWIRIRAKSYKKPPFIIGPKKVDGKAVILSDEQAEKIKGGDFARLYVSPFWYTKGTPGVALYLSVVQFSHEGASLGGGREKVLSEIDEIEVGVDDVEDSIENQLGNI